MEIMSFYIKVLEIFYEHERPYFDADKKPDILHCKILFNTGI